jgi:conjugal transfer pilus assembly protein TraE
MALFRKEKKLENDNNGAINKPYIHESSNIFAENKLLRFLFFGILCVCLMNTYSIQKIGENNQTIITPPGQSTNYRFIGGSPDETYLRDMFLYSISLATSYSAANVDEKLVILKSLWAQKDYEKFEEILKKNADDIKRFNQISYNTVWDASKPLTIEGNSITGTFIKKKVVSTKVAAQTTLQYKLRYKINSSRFEIIDIKEIGGDAI